MNTRRSRTSSRFIRVNAAAAGLLYNKVLLRVEDLVNASGILVYGKKIVIIKPESRRRPPSLSRLLSFTSTDYPTLVSWPEAVNESVRNVVVFETDKDEPTDSLIVTSLMCLTCGQDVRPKLLKQEMGEALRQVTTTRATSSIRCLPFDNWLKDYYYSSGVYADDDAGMPNKRFR